MLPAVLAASAANLVPAAMNVREIARTKPTPMSAVHAYEQLGDATGRRIEEISPGRPNPGVRIDTVTPQPGLEGLKDVILNPGKYSGAKQYDTGRWSISANPNADRAIFAHELGHITSAQTDVGHLVRQARANPKLGKALMGAALLGGGTAAALTPGDDDLAASVGLAYASAVPSILDESLATKNALAIMDNAGLRATLGQRGKLAGGLLAYMGAPLLLGATTNMAGNFVDEDPDEQTSGTLMP